MIQHFPSEASSIDGRAAADMPAALRAKPGERGYPHLDLGVGGRMLVSTIGGPAGPAARTTCSGTQDRRQSRSSARGLGTRTAGGWTRVGRRLSEASRTGGRSPVERGSTRSSGLMSCCRESSARLPPPT